MNETLLHPLNHLGCIHVQGEERKGFLQGQLCNDIGLLTGVRGQLSAYNSPKGRMLAVLHLTQTGDRIRLEIERSVLEATLKRLRLFVLRSKVSLEDATTHEDRFGLSGDRAAQVLAEAGLPAPLQPLDSALVDGITILRRHGVVPRFSLHGAADALGALRARLAATLPTADADEWRRHDILAGVPAVLPATSDRFVPQMANLDLLGGISFNKGCYTGQEIVARMHYLGQLKRRLFWARTAARDVEAGAPVYDGDGAQAVGEVMQTAVDGDGTLLGVVMQLSHAGSEALHLGGDHRVRVSQPQKPPGLAIAG